jgi:hypothetical protein
LSFIPKPKTLPTSRPAKVSFSGLLKGNQAESSLCLLWKRCRDFGGTFKLGYHIYEISNFPQNFPPHLKRFEV